MILLALQMFVALALLSTVLISCKKLNIDINIHNISMAVFFGAIIIASMIISYKDFTLQVIIGVILYIYRTAIKYFYKDELKKFNIKLESNSQHFTNLFLYLLFWSHIISLNYFVKSNLEKLVEGVNEDI